MNNDKPKTLFSCAFVFEDYGCTRKWRYLEPRSLLVAGLVKGKTSVKMNFEQ